MGRRSRYINITEVKRDGETYYRARLHFAFDEEQGIQPPPKDFYAKTKEDADKKRREYKPQKETLDKDTTLGDFLLKEFIPDQELKVDRGEMGFQHCQDRQYLLKRWVLEPQHAALKAHPIHKVILARLKPTHMFEFFKGVKRAGVPIKYQHRLKDTLHLALRSAKHRIPDAPKIYFEDLELPPNPQRQTQDVLVFDPAHIQQVLRDPSRSVKYRAIAAFLFIMQCRPSEMWALTWADIDLQAGTATFSKRVSKTREGWQVLDGSKNTRKTGQKTSRTLGMGVFLTGLLRDYYEGLSASGTVPETVFTTSEGRPLNKERFKKLWDKMRKDLELPQGPRFYSLKHLGNSIALSTGATVAAQSSRMGHSSDKMANQVYRALLKHEEQQSATVLDNFMQPQGALTQ